MGPIFPIVVGAFMFIPLLIISSVYNLITEKVTEKEIRPVKNIAKNIGGTIYDLSRITAYAVIPTGLYISSIYSHIALFSEYFKENELEVFSFFVFTLLLISGYHSLRFLLRYKSFYIERVDYLFFLVLVPLFVPLAGGILIRIAFWFYYDLLSFLL
ncbi:hypothetical protein M5J14_12520 [Lysinibacillus sp. OL1_EC]|uniref:hypothetical protein n=1 Tax=unclassified Lysinibacillus TaxID=2636778 RepID=UPI00103AF75F|nr:MULTISPECIES: hypothetical protein [unclassified Lysinibacillus]MCM0625329.1 hypothetical protein [Lysinibacillus sp. OL1_EC]TBV87144.1 hypothetical protein EW028_14720 [Lysinibacillus sp. OL1]UKJ44309.1 hypothetical protein L6W14_16280 [Lysinibacillus sp. ACHW1.5]